MAMKNETELLLTNGTATVYSTDDNSSGGKDRRQVQSPSPGFRQGNVGEFTGEYPISSPAMGGRQVDSYFDAHPWFDSDGEDYHSVNGDFGSSRSFSPIVDSKTESEPQPIQSPMINNKNQNEQQRRSSTTSRSSSSMKKQLSEFFSESFNRNLEAEIETNVANQQRKQHPYGTNYSDTSTDNTSPHDILSNPDQETATVKKKSAVKRACIPSLMRSLSCGGGKN